MSDSQAEFRPSRPLRRSEFHVDFGSILAHITEQRRLVEAAGVGFIPRILVLVNAGIPTHSLELEMVGALEAAIDRTVAFGFVTAQQEITRMRSQITAAAEAPLPRGYKFPDAGRHGAMARTMAGTYRVVSMRARQTASSVVEAAKLHRHDVRGPEIFARVELHRCALGMVGEALNLGRAAGARNYGRAVTPDDQLALAEGDSPPEFAMRSEALDERTCTSCDDVHGEIVQVDSAEFYDLMPPAYCEGADRCRGVYVFEDGPAPEVRGPAGEPGPQPRPPEVPPISVAGGNIDRHPNLNQDQLRAEISRARSRVSSTKSRLVNAPADASRALLDRMAQRLTQQERELQQLQTSLSVKQKREAFLRVQKPDQSVAAGLPRRAQEKIDRLGLDQWPQPKGPAAERIFGSAHDTEQLYRNLDGSWNPEREQLHREIIDAHFRDKVVAQEKQAYFTAGGSASGKGSSLFRVEGKDVRLDELQTRNDVVHIDPDAIKAMLPEYQQMVEQGDVFAASGVHEESSYLAKEITQIAYDRGYSVLIDTTGSGGSFTGKIEAAYLRGYKTQVTMTSIPTRDAVLRSLARGDKSGRYVALQPLREAHAGASKQLLEWQHDKNISWRVYDNTRTQELVAKGDQGRIEVLNQGRYNEILAKRDETVVEQRIPKEDLASESKGVYYHVTPESNVQSILEAGLNQPINYVYSTREAAEAFAKAQEQLGYGPQSILEVRVPKDVQLERGTSSQREALATTQPIAARNIAEPKSDSEAIFDKSLPVVDKELVRDLSQEQAREEEKKVAKAIAGLKWRIVNGNLSKYQLEAAERRLGELQGRREELRARLGLSTIERLNPYLTKTWDQLNSEEKALKKKLSADRYYRRKAEEAGRPDRIAELEKRIAENEKKLQQIAEARGTVSRKRSRTLARPLRPEPVRSRGNYPGVVDNYLSPQGVVTGPGSLQSYEDVIQGMRIMDRIFASFGPEADNTLTFTRLNDFTMGSWSRGLRLIRIDYEQTSKFGYSSSDTFWHEFGHMLDYRQIGEDPYLATSESFSARRSAGLEDWWSAVEKSQPYERIAARAVQGDTHAEYLARPRELWARAFAQYIYTKGEELYAKGLLSKGEELTIEKAEQFESKRMTDLYGTQWSPREFAPIYKAMDEFFRRKGWLR